MKINLGLAFICAVLAWNSGYAAGDPAQGKQIFLQRCSICHRVEPNDGGGGQGPSLINLMNRKAGSAAQFPYTSALRQSGIHWDAATLDKFLKAPSALVPGTAMVIAVESSSDRANLISYFESLPVVPTAKNDDSIDIPAQSRASADWKQDAPGRVHGITATSLPAAFATKSSRNFTEVVEKPAGAQLSLPSGFQIDVFTDALLAPRKMLAAADGSVIVSETVPGKVMVLAPSTDGIHAGKASTFAEGLKQPFGMAFYPDSKNPRWLYVAENNRIVRFSYRTGDSTARGPAEVVTNDVPGGVGHYTRDIAFDPDGKHFWVSVGSGSNVAESMPKKSPQEIKDWAAQQPLGAAWDSEFHRAAVLEFDANKAGSPTLYATGIRNCVSLTVQPANNALWCTTNERDALGDDLVPDYSTRVQKSQFYGWPWYYIGNNQDPRHPDERPDLAGKVAIPDVLYQSHSASLSLMFYAANSGKSAFPSEYFGDAFAAFHGSWNRSLRTGYKIVRLPMDKNEPTGKYEDFLTGFIVDNKSVWGRPVGLLQLADGSLLLSEDGNNKIYRISYSKPH
jgi:glucose/arabinose dehydrogenase/cytochrome c2